MQANTIILALIIRILSEIKIISNPNAYKIYLSIQTDKLLNEYTNSTTNKDIHALVIIVITLKRNKYNE
jgi:hypothetical protein